jgi:hypothetical protein
MPSLIQESLWSQRPYLSRSATSIVSNPWQTAFHHSDIAVECIVEMSGEQPMLAHSLNKITGAPFSNSHPRLA